MRTSARFIVSALLTSLLLSGTVQATEPSDPVAKENSFDVLMYLGAHGKVNLNLAINRSKRVTVTLMDVKKDVLYQDFLKQSPHCYQLKFNFEGSKSGVYQIEISDGKNTVVRQVEVVDMPTIEPQRYIVYNPQSSR